MAATEVGLRREATAPPEVRGSGRDDVALLVARRASGGIEHLRFADLASVLEPGDVLVVNNSATVPAALDALDLNASDRNGGPQGAVVRVDHGDDADADVANIADIADQRSLRLHISTRLPGDLWAVEPRRPAGVSSLPLVGTSVGPELSLPGGERAVLLERAWGSRRLWIARLTVPGPALAEYLDTHGQPIRYRYITEAWPIEAYQSVFSVVPGSAEMPSASRPFTAGLVTTLVSIGVEIVPVTLHTGVSSLEAGEAPYPEMVEVGEDAAERINRAREAGRRIIAVGTTAVRAVESAADRRGRLHPMDGWTDVVIGPDHPVRAVDGLLTGWHEPESTHLLMLEAVGGSALVNDSYAAAQSAGYLWHEFGDVHLILP